MYISRLSIRNYRNFRNVSLNFKKGVNTIIGENGSGKTNLFKAMRILIDESMPRVINFIESDFNRSIGCWNGHWIIIQLEFSELDVSDEALALSIHKVGVVDEFESSIGTYTLFFRPRIDIRRNLFAISKEPTKNLEQLNDILSSINLNDYEVVFTGKGNIDFSIDDHYTKYVGNFESIEFPDPDEERTDVYGIRLHGFSIPNEFACTFAKALRDVESDLRSHRDNPLLSLLRDKEKNIKVEKKEDIENKVNDLNTSISNLDEVKAVSLGITSTVKDSVGETYAPNINIKSELPADMEMLLQSLKLWVGDPDEAGYEGRLWELSLGGANLIYLSLKLLEFEKVKRHNKIANFILIEEPEAHIHTHIQKTLFHKLKSENTQVFISTHSTHISSVCQISSMNILGRGNQLAEVYSPSNQLDWKTISKIERYLDASRTNLLFAKGVILVEGDAEQIIIPELIKKVLGVSLDEIGVSLINIGSTGFSNISILFDESRIRRKCGILTDNDISIIDLPEDISQDTPFQKSCRESQRSGKERKEKLDELSAKNDWVKSFFAKHTFEVDFLMSNNSFEINKTVKAAYTNASQAEKIKKLIDNKDISISGKEVLRLANKFGKGWFALMLSENITNLTFIPDYIINSLLFAAPKFSDSILTSIAKHRLVEYKKNRYNGDKNDYEKLLEEFNSIASVAGKIESFKEWLPNDVLTKIVAKLDA